MKIVLRNIFALFAVALTATGLTYLWFKDHRVVDHRVAATVAGAAAYPAASVPTAPDPNPASGSKTVFFDPAEFDNGVFESAARFTGDHGDESSLTNFREAIAARVPRAKAWLKTQEEVLRLGQDPTPAELRKAIGVCREAAFISIYEGDHQTAATWLLRGLEFAKLKGAPVEGRPECIALLGINALRRGEQDNCIGCVGPSSCIFPIDPLAVHLRPSGSREAIYWFTQYLDEWPGDLRVRWLLNIAAMTLGEYPQGVPKGQLIPLNQPPSSSGLGRFNNVATTVGVVARGPDLAGGSLFDDFTGDGLPDVFTTSFDVNHGASLYVNLGDGTFEDRSEDAGLDDQVYSLNATRADYDNDGDLDILMFRGGWEKPARMSLLRNDGKGVFEDVTLESGLGDPIATESGVWADYDQDGHVDLFVCGEFTNGGPADPRNACRLYHNAGDGTFIDVAPAAGVENNRWAKGSAWGDYDDDGRIDLFVSNMGDEPRLYHNEGDGTFRDVAPELKLKGSPHSFACMFLDYDNDGRSDIFVTDWGGSLSGFVGDYLGLRVGEENHARLYRNLGKEGFREVSTEVGLARPIAVMSMNAGDLDNDGNLDLHLGSGWMLLSGLIPDLTYRNVGGRFVDVTEETGTGHLQKGHGVSFADFDDDGDEDLFVVLGGGYPGDRGYNALFRNPGHGRHWLKVRLIGTKSNRSAFGAKIRAEFTQKDGVKRSVYRVVGNNASFGGNSLTELIGLSDAANVDRLTVTWPIDGSVQTFENLPADQSVEITEGTATYHARPRPTP
jgi:hypothetical protein